MNKKITEAFTKGKAFIPFVTCGDPSLEVTEKIVYAMVEAGADLIELGIPFSDPTAEGPVIQGANLRALSGGVTTDKVFEMVEKIRRNTDIPMVFMTYANVVFSYGTERFCKRAAEVWTGSDLADRTDLSRKNFHDSKRSRRLCLLCFFSWSDGNEKSDYYRHRSYGKACKSTEGHSVCSRIWYFHAGTGQKNGCSGRWRHSRISNCQTL